MQFLIGRCDAVTLTAKSFSASLPRMLPNDKYPIAQRETLIRKVRDRSIERSMSSDARSDFFRRGQVCQAWRELWPKLSTECRRCPVFTLKRGGGGACQGYRVRLGVHEEELMMLHTGDDDTRAPSELEP